MSFLLSCRCTDMSFLSRSHQAYCLQFLLAISMPLLASCKQEKTEVDSPSASVVLSSASAAEPRDGELDVKRVIGYLQKICSIGSRTTGSRGMKEQQELLEVHFQNLGAKILWQPFDGRHPETGGKVEIRNLVVQWLPENAQRVLICTHYDTKPFPSQDPVNPKGLFVGANDGGSGTALLMEMGHVLKDLPLDVGVDFVFFDAEELVFDERRDEFFLGSKYFARAYASDTSGPRYRAGILLDMVGDADLQIYYEENSFKYAKGLVQEVWGIAKELRISEFEPRIKHTVNDDHMPLNQIAGIPTIDIIDFDYYRGSARNKSYWHTTQDTPDKCSGASMVKVGRVLVEWLKRQGK
jgi:glutaminyl-peptide cyclotransferase